MRRDLLSLFLAVLGSAAACGPAKPAETAHEEDTATPPPAAASGAGVDADQPPPATPHADAPPTPPPGIRVPYDKEEVEIVLKRAARQVKANCGSATGENGKAEGPWGKVSVSVKLGHNGHSAGATVEAPYDGRPVGKCITQAFAILIFPPFPGPDVTVDWPVEVVAPAGAH